MTKESAKVTELGELGEFKLIDHLTNNIPLIHHSTIKGVGDDAAVMDYGGDEYTIMTTDMLSEGIHFDLIYTPLKHLGYKAAVVNFSDIYAMNAVPKQMTVSLAVSGKFSFEALNELYEGIYKACENYDVDLVGGDTTSSLTGLTISITVIGTAPKDRLTYRNSAQINDIICVTGDLGAAYMGLQLLEREKKVFQETGVQNQSDLSGYEYIIERLLKPEARKGLGPLLKEHDIQPTSMIDISDGLSSDVLHICNTSQCGCKIFKEQIPIAEETGKMAKKMNLEPTICAMNGGDDYELLFTVSIDDYDKIKGVQGISMIGHITDKENGAYLYPPQGEPIEIKAQGWNSFLEE
ncbi:MAG: thiamine-phosphate kinase [Bacteroidota bacterium]